MTYKLWLGTVAALTLAACSGSNSDTQTQSATTDTEAVSEAASTGSGTDYAGEQTAAAKGASLDEILADQPESVKARYEARNPKATLEYFGLESGMTVAEVLPGGGWYSKIILPHLGEDGTLIGVDYDIDMWANFGGFANETFIENRRNWSDTWAADARSWVEGGADIDAFTFGERDTAHDGTVDLVLMVRAMHHLNRFDPQFMDDALTDIMAMLKPGGVVGIVQHRGPESNSDAWAKGDNGYLKQSFVIKTMTDAGFELVGEPSEINANPADMPSESDMVWRLAPTLGTSQDNPELRAKMQAIGETDRMTLKFRKPS